METCKLQVDAGQPWWGFSTSLLQGPEWAVWIVCCKADAPLKFGGEHLALHHFHLQARVTTLQLQPLAPTASQYDNPRLPIEPSRQLGDRESSQLTTLQKCLGEAAEEGAGVGVAGRQQMGGGPLRKTACRGRWTQTLY
jgi:hypothetical protein